ncbi:hypothetical protein BB934_07610 [Microvirga ossetica]|uniref:Uncharacterized protein n=1 Tax=Microvirga ossetica TaxID=1882682 RepID=A0A1B2EDP9_9HYPH|nr:hypothetical protein [Microvirga ossetica]ANY78114.1 hypothetical protein BB934_07610 [Microvirga ossetica]
MQFKSHIEKFRKCRKRTADGTLYYIAEGFLCRSHHTWRIYVQDLADFILLKFLGPVVIV